MSIFIPKQAQQRFVSLTMGLLTKFAFHLNERPVPPEVKHPKGAGWICMEVRISLHVFCNLSFPPHPIFTNALKSEHLIKHRCRLCGRQSRRFSPSHAGHSRVALRTITNPQVSTGLNGSCRLKDSATEKSDGFVGVFFDNYSLVGSKVATERNKLINKHLHGWMVAQGSVGLRQLSQYVVHRAQKRAWKTSFTWLC